MGIKHITICVYVAVWLILLIVVHIIENKEPKIDDFGAIFVGISCKSSTVTYHV